MHKGIKVYLLTEGGVNIGFGHISRCIALYQAFEEKGIKPQIIINADDSVADLVKGKNYYLIKWLEQADELFEKIEESEIVIIDSYLADIDLYNKISKKIPIPVYIDDNKRLKYPKGIVINGAIYAEELNYPESEGVNYLLGPKYQILRKEFWEVPEKTIREKIMSVMITFGGNDSKNITPKVLDLLVKNYPGLTKNVIIGRGFQNIKEIEKVADKNTNIIYNADAKKMKKIMLNSDIAISAGGQTLVELARVGVPSIAVVVADNQYTHIYSWRKKGLIDLAGVWDSDEVNINILKKIKNYSAKKPRVNISNSLKKIIDGNGPVKIVDNILNRL